MAQKLPSLQQPPQQRLPPIFAPFKPTQEPVLVLPLSLGRLVEGAHGNMSKRTEWRERRQRRKDVGGNGW